MSSVPARAWVVPSATWQLSSAPPDALVLGHVLSAHGIRGSVKVVSHSGSGENLAKLSECWLRKTAQTYRVGIQAARAGTDAAFMQFDGIADRTTAEALIGAEVLALREQLPPPEPDSYYWVDLIGCAVHTASGGYLGTIRKILSTGAHDVIETATDDTPVRVRLIPFVNAYVKTVDVDAKRVVVDWDPDWD